MKTKPTIRVVTATEAKNRFGDIIKSAYLREEHLIITRDKIPVVAIVPILEYQRAFPAQDFSVQPSQEVYAANGQSLENEGEEVRSAAERARAWSDFLAFLDSVHQHMPDVSEEEVERDIAEAIQAVRAGKPE